MKNNKSAISLIVLVITIIVLSILATVVILSLVDTNIISLASSTAFKADMANYKEACEIYVTKQLVDDLTFDREKLNVTYANNSIVFKNIFGDNVPDKYKERLRVVHGKLMYETDDETEKAVLEELNIKSLITKGIAEQMVSPYIGYYADVDGDGLVDGVIFADLAYSVSGGTYGTTSVGTFEYKAVTDKNTLKDYVVSQESYTAMNESTTLSYGTKPVLRAIDGTTGTNRFYVMKLSDLVVNNKTTFCWYYSKNGSLDVSRTAADFGSGKQNTYNMISDWNSDTSSDKNTRDVWNAMQEQAYDTNYNKENKTVDDLVWFLPSNGEWSAFAYYLNNKDTDPLTTSNYLSAYGLNSSYWTSSSWSKDVATIIAFNYGFVSNAPITGYSYIRLATTF